MIGSTTLAPETRQKIRTDIYAGHLEIYSFRCTGPPAVNFSSQYPMTPATAPDETDGLIAMSKMLKVHPS